MTYKSQNPHLPPTPLERVSFSSSSLLSPSPYGLQTSSFLHTFFTYLRPVKKMKDGKEREENFLDPPKMGTALCIQYFITGH